ncbi:MAG: chloride channel protein, partial [Pseudomonadota bacterium]
ITSYLEFPAFALLGLTCAVVAIAFQSSLIVTDRVAAQSKLPIWLRPALGGLFIGCVGVFYPHILGVGYEATDQALKGQLPLTLMITLLVLKTAATAVTLASRFGGGIFSASLYLGAMAGGAFGQVAASVAPDAASTYGLYAILGMGAVAASMLGAPISTTLIVFELTGGYDVTIALLLAVVVATTVSQAVLGQSFFAWQLRQRGTPVDQGPHQEILRRLCVSEFMTTISPQDRDRVGDVDGTVRRDPDKPSLLPHSCVDEALQALDKSGQRRVAVVSEAGSDIVVGWVDEVRALNAFNEALIDAHKEEHR